MAGRIDQPFVRDNLSYSHHGVVRGLWFQHPHDQRKLVSVESGEVFDVAEGVRSGSPFFGAWVGVYLSGQNHHQLFIPAGFVHEFVVTSAGAVFAYKCTAFHHPEAERSIRWDGPDLAIGWPPASPIVYAKDAAAPFLSDVPQGDLPGIERR